VEGQTVDNSLQSVDINANFAEQLKRLREARGLSQEELAFRSGLDRTYISQLERGLKSPTLNTLADVARCLNVGPAELLRDVPPKTQLSVLLASNYLVREVECLELRRGKASIPMSTKLVFQAVDRAHELIDQIYSMQLDIAMVLGRRNLSAFIGELLAAAIVQVADGKFRHNPHQDGYPDLLFMDEIGKRAWEAVEHQRGDKAPFNNFAGGGIEIKATCGSVPTPARCRKLGTKRPELGDSRIGCMIGYDWKAHHRQTNNLLGVLWDFIDRRPRIAALFYRADLNSNDWGKIVHPREDGGRTTSVSIMARSGIRKMYEGWLCVLSAGGYAEILNRKNKGSLIPTEPPQTTDQHASTE
jgi:transcriptional regulator with XRE-family HTH domain